MMTRIVQEKAQVQPEQEIQVKSEDKEDEEEDKNEEDEEGEDEGKDDDDYDKDDDGFSGIGLTSTAGTGGPNNDAAQENGEARAGGWSEAGKVELEADAERSGVRAQADAVGYGEGDAATLHQNGVDGAGGNGRQQVAGRQHECLEGEAKHFTEVEFGGGNKCEEQNSKVFVHDKKEDVLDKEAEPDVEVEIIGGYNCEEQDPKVEVHVEKEAVLEKYSSKNGDQAESFPSSMKDNDVSTRDSSPSILQTIQVMQRERKRKMTDGAARKPTKDAKGQTKTSKDHLEKETREKSNMESGRKDATTSNTDNLDQIISMIIKSTMKDSLDVDTSFRVECQVPCASNIEDQKDRNTEFVVLSTVEDMKIIMKKSEPPEENDDAYVDASDDASCAGGVVGVGDDTEIIIDMDEPPQEDGDASVDAGGVGEDTDIIIEKSESPQEDGDASMEVGGEARCADGAVGASEDTEMTIENSKPPQGDGDASVDAGGDGSCAVGAEYVRHDDGTMSRQREDGGGAGGVVGYVRNDDEMVSRPWEDPGNILFESKLAPILDINGVLLTSVDKRYRSQMPTYWNDLEIVDRAGVFAGYKRDALAFLDWCLVHFDDLCGPAA
ncbi:hypothetical protein L7F22_016168 [Adiantum nelumboides]|nr:hypothetical protein [Adiantum nelumboides]